MDKSRIFVGCRSIGEVSGKVPLVARYIKTRRETLLVTVVGRCFHTYGADHLSLLAVSGSHPSPIVALAADTYHIYTSAGNQVYAWRRGTELKHEYGPHGAPVHLLLPFATLLLTVDDESTLKAWYIKEEEEYLEIPFDNKVFKISTLMHPATYLNKILLGSEQGALQLWNIKTSKLVHTFTGWNSGVTVTEQAPAVDVVAIGLANGNIILHNLKVDKTVMKFHQDWGLVTSISFRTDGHPIMVTGSSAGHLVMWNLEEKRVAHQLHKAHTRIVSGAICFPSEPIMATNSPDNSLKIWMFDMPDGGARLLRVREGHSAAPYFIRYVGTDGKSVLSAGADSALRILSSTAGHHPESLGRASYNRGASKKKNNNKDTHLMPPVINFSYSMHRDKEWDSIAAIHRGMNMVTTWSLDKKKMGSHKIVPEKMDKTVTVTCLNVSHCGNFVFIGYSNGEVYKFNMQSGLMRGRWSKAHAGPVRGVETDNLNRRLMTCGVDKRFRVWGFEESKVPLKVIPLEEAVSFTRCQRESSLIALCNEDFTLVLIDLDSVNIVRKFDGHSSKINDMCFSHDSRWLLSAGMDCTIRIWDIPTGQLIDIFKVECPCTSLSMSPKGNFMVTSHVGQLGVYLWGNRTLYAHINLRPLNLENLLIPTIELPTIANDTSQETLEEFKALTLQEELDFKSPEQISEELITLSNLPTSKWQNLLNLDVIKQRNKPKAPPKVPKAAPFFLPTVPNLDLQFDLSSGDKDGESKVMNALTFSNLTPFGRMLEKAGETENYNECIDRMKSFGPSMIDFEVNNFALDNGGSVEVMVQFLKMIDAILKSNKDFELGQAYLSLFLKVHGPIIVETVELRTALEEVEKDQIAGWERLQEMMFYNLCVVKSIKNM